LRSEVGSQQNFSIVTEPLTLEDLGQLSQFSIRGELQKIDDVMLRLRGTITVSVGLLCDRCLKEFLLPVSVSIDEVFSRSPETDQWSITPDGNLDLSEAVRQQILLNLPTHPLCAPDCKGLCQLCGQELRVCHHSPNRDTLSPEVKLSRLKD
jgi:uncharacterized protein